MLPDDLTLELMRHDAESSGQDPMQQWADGGACPFNNRRQDFMFRPRRKLWQPGEPQLRGIELLEALWAAKGGK
jgi:hypothetical protein